MAVMENSIIISAYRRSSLVLRPPVWNIATLLRENTPGV